MARIVVYSNAYRGDVYPFVPIASELARRGHDVRFSCPAEFHASFAAEPFECVDSGCDTLAPAALDEHADITAKNGMRFGGALQMRLYFKKLTIPYLDAFVETIRSQLSDADLLVSHPAAALIGSIAAELEDVPWVDGDLFPMLIPTATRSPDPLPDLGPRLNAAIWKLGRTKLVAPLTSERDFAAYRATRGLDSTQRSPLDAMRSPHLSLGLASPRYVEPAPDWPATLTMTGFSMWEGPDNGRLDSDISEFLDGGDPPVLVTLGTSAASAAPDRFTEALTALDSLGRRGLFLTSNETIADQLRPHNTDGRHGIWPFAPLSAVLPRCAGAVHSGAHGTNAMVLAAGLPSVVSPVLFDQVWHANRQEQLGTGIHAKKRAGLTPAISAMLADTTMAQRAKNFGTHLAQEDGPNKAATTLETFLTTR